MGKNNILSRVFVRREKKASDNGQRPQQDLKSDPRSRPYLLVVLIGRVTLGGSALQPAQQPFFFFLNKHQ